MLHFLASLVAKVFMLGLIVALIVGVIGFFCVMTSDRSNSGSSNNQGGLPWL